MECFRMHYTLASLLIIAVKVSDAADIEFLGIEPKTVLVGDNVTFRWRYNGSRELFAARLDTSESDELLYFGFGYVPSSSPPPVQYYPRNAIKYAALVNWTGNISAKEFSFMLTDLKEFSHDKIFFVTLVSKKHEDKSSRKLLISVLPKVMLRIDRTNVSVNDRITIECRTVKEGRPKARITWYHNNKLVPGANSPYLFNGREVELKDSGSYKCAAENDAGGSESNVISITVNEKAGKDGAHGKDGADGKSTGDLGGGAIAGIVIAITIVIFVVIIAMVVVLKKKKNTPETNKQTGQDESISPMVSNAREKDQVWL